MLKIQTVTLLFLLTLLACTPVKKNKLTVLPPQCLASQSKCSIETQFGHIDVLFNRNKILTEVPFSIYLKLVNDEILNEYKILQVKAYMEGKEMFMGKIPVFFSHVEQKNTLVAETLLGSCSEEQMVWRLWLTVFFEEETDKKSTGNLQETFFIDFTSSRF